MTKEPKEPIAAYIKVVIDETTRDNTNDEALRRMTIREDFRTIEEVKDFMTERYGRVPGGRRKIYQDTPTGAIAVGFLYTFWNRDMSHNSKAWLQTDWITITDVQEYPRAM